MTGGSVRTGPSDQAVDLAEGDSVHFGAACPHVYRGLGPRNRALLLMLHPGHPLRRGGVTGIMIRRHGPRGPRAARSVGPVVSAGSDRLDEPDRRACQRGLTGQFPGRGAAVTSPGPSQRPAGAS